MSEERQQPNEPTADSAYKALGRPDHEAMEAKALLVRQIHAAMETRGLSIPAVARIVHAPVDEVDRVLRGVMRSYAVWRLGAWLDWLVSGRDFEYSDDDRNYGEDMSSPVERRIRDAGVRVDQTYQRLRREARGRVAPLRYEALLRRVENVAIEFGGGGCAAADLAERRLGEIEDDLAALLAAGGAPKGAPAADGYAYREDEEGYGEYGLGAEDGLHDTSRRLERLGRRLRRLLRGRLVVEEYEALSARVARATVEFRGGILEAAGAAERAVIEIRAEIDARAAELDAADDGDWLERLSAERRASSPTFAEAEKRAQAEGGGYEVHRMTDGGGKILDKPELVAHGDENGPLPLDSATSEGQSEE